MNHEDTGAMKAVAKAFHTDGYQAAAGDEIPVPWAAEPQAEAEAIRAELVGQKSRAARSRYYRRKWGSDRITLPHRRWF